MRDDFPDWGAAPSLLLYNPVSVTIASASLPIASFDMANYQYGVLTVQRDNTPIQNDLAFQWMGTVGAESTIITQSRFTVLDGGTIIIPFQALTPTLRIQDVDASTYPYDIGVSLSLLTSPIYQHGFPGGIFAINDTRTIAGGATETFTPDGCGPGEHVFHIGTTSPDWNLDIELYPRRSAPISIVDTHDIVGSLVGFTVTLPATQWQMLITNEDADADFSVAVFRTPNPQ